VIRNPFDKPVKEKVVERKFREGIKARGGEAYKFTSPNRRSVPDRLVLMPGGRASFVELKREGEKATDMQLREHEHLRSLGFDVQVVIGNQGLKDYFEELDL